MTIYVGSSLRRLSDGNRERFLTFVNTRHVSGTTAMVDCVESHKVASFNLLLQNGADDNIAGHVGNNPLLYAARLDNDCCKSIITPLLEKVKSDYANEPYRLKEYLDRRNNDGENAFLSPPKATIH
ncbi:hypothetical protein N7G274_008010 [Stereocaulon virgatum]|uniref:Ankyrin repeat protein n=1 Tax=Stereocaulon virgatum TaxID=373712 RepID=A0ABR4A077_9LECA